MDVETTFYACAFLQIGWIIASGIWLWRKHDELPVILSLFLFYVFTFRFWALLQGWATSVNISPFGFAPVSTVYCLEAAGLAVLGQTVLIGIYMLTQGQAIIPRRLYASSALLYWLRSRTFLLLAMCAPLAVWTRGMVGAQIGAGKSMAFEISSYLSLFPMVLISVGILLVMVWKIGGLPSSAQKGIGVSAGAAIAWLTFNSSSRFQFLGWILGATIIVTSDLRLARKILLGLIGLVVAAALFAVAGAMRSENDSETGLQEQSVNRFAFAADANMLDGFVLLRQVYPHLLDFSYGGEHLEILTRPIPRAWWPDKPVGGYINKLGMVDASTGFTLGISPSIFGSFYQEGGFIAVILLSAIYGFGLARLIRFSAVIHPVGGTLIRAITCAAVVPLLRGGDLPGIYAWFGMAFWPCFLVLWIWRKELLAKITPSQIIMPTPPPPASTEPAQIPISDAAPLPSGKDSEAPQSASAEPPEEAIRLRAYFISERRRERSMPGDAAHDWIEAQRELLEEGQV